jgi:hypothetical protein
MSFFFRLRLLRLLLPVRSALRRRPRTCVRGRHIGHVFTAACVNRKSVRVRADDSRWPVQRAHRFHGAPETHWLTGSIVHAARQFGMAKYRFARVAIDLSYALFSGGRFKAWLPEINHRCILCISSAHPISPVVDPLSFTTPVSGNLCIVVASLWHRRDSRNASAVSKWITVDCRTAGKTDDPSASVDRIMGIRCLPPG